MKSQRKRTVKKPTQSEREITAAIRGLLKTLGVFHWKQFQTLGSTPGVPDIIGILRGRMLGIEVKTKRGKVSEHQQKFIDIINSEHLVLVNLRHLILT